MIYDLSGWDNHSNEESPDFYESDQEHHKSEHNRVNSENVYKSSKKVTLLKRRNQPDKKLDKLNWKYLWKEKGEVNILTVNSFCQSLLNHIPVFDEPLKKLSKSKLKKLNKNCFKNQETKQASEVLDHGNKVSVVNVLEKFNEKPRNSSKIKEELGGLCPLQKCQKLKPLSVKKRNSRSTYNLLKHENMKNENQDSSSSKENSCFIMPPCKAGYYEINKTINFFGRKLKKSTSDYLSCKK